MGVTDSAIICSSVWVKGEMEKSLQSCASLWYAIFCSFRMASASSIEACEMNMIIVEVDVGSNAHWDIYSVPFFLRLTLRHLLNTSLLKQPP